ncbi:unnamed protein product [Colletotrichum noveboracense]|uniref:Uncharacterized protein n=1 Tax=Colletotrichum noveboracense TaxID=2664923 RepID=A0A9W4S6M8_9PEZI|nr:unnamed protein product [Colletotrichum noveboracense]
MATRETSKSDNGSKLLQWPPRRLENGTSRHLEMFMNSVSILMAVVVAVYVGLLFRFNGLEIQDSPAMWRFTLEFNQLAPTIVPLMFAFVLGRTIRSFAHWRLQRGERVGFLDSLLGSTTMTGTVTTMIDMKSIRWSSIVLVLIWAFSPLGGQAALRVLLKKPEAVVSFAELPYLDVNTSFPAQYIGSNIGNAQLPINSLVYSALGASGEVRQSSQDTSGNVKIPMIEPLLGRHSTKADEWITLNDEDRASITWSSLIGIPFGNISRTGRTSFKLETSYLKMDCPIFEETEHASELVVDGGLDCTIPINGKTFNCSTLTSWGGLSTTPYPDGRTNGTRRRCIDPTASARDFHYFDWSPAKDEPTYAKCKINSTYVETQIACDGYNCIPTAIRSSVSPRNPSTNFTFFDSCQSNNELASLYFQNLFKSLTDPTNRQKSPSIIQTYIVDPEKGLNATAVFDFPRAIHAGRENFEIRMAQLLNTYWLATIGNEPLVLGHPENYDMLSYRNTVHATNFTSTNATIFTPITVLRYDTTWMVILIISVVVLFTAAIAGLLIDFGVWVPKLLLNISTLTRGNPNFGVPAGGGAFTDEERSRLLGDLRVRFGDAEMSGDKHDVVIGDCVEDGGRVAKLTHRRLYL